MDETTKNLLLDTYISLDPHGDCVVKASKFYDGINKNIFLQ